MPARASSRPSQSRSGCRTGKRCQTERVSACPLGPRDVEAAPAPEGVEAPFKTGRFETGPFKAELVESGLIRTGLTETDSNAAGTTRPGIPSSSFKYLEAIRARRSFQPSKRRSLTRRIAACIGSNPELKPPTPSKSFRLHPSLP